MATCNVAKCNCKKFASSHSEPTNCECGHAESQHSDSKTGNNGSKARGTGPRPSASYNKPLPPKDKPLPKREDNEKSSKGQHAGEVLLPVATSITMHQDNNNSNSNNNDKIAASKRLSVGNRQSRLPSTHQYSQSATLPAAKANEKSTGLQTSTTITIQPKPSTTTIANVVPPTAHSNGGNITNANNAISELRDYLAEYKEESTHLMDLKNGF
ncbi:hypothetical protein RFI_19262 [Reticulomyxa filosa]|uniref:Uncharacterized protein n=1 Tax=Reticulomyxa filosa TaxID=46433 RepID=X6MVL3_RETFI|nr:hypothetical protein RFI_19262 [Reticulomyxa filosa]|eukprot:ETO18033.1 hypothetical protein RFI_19262 [Reticulomyxa filosa]